MRRRTCAGLVVGLVATTITLLDQGAAPATTRGLTAGDVVRDVPLPTGGVSVGVVRRDGDRVVGVFKVDGVARVLQDDLADADGWVPVPGQDDPDLTSPVGVESAAGGVTVVARAVPAGASAAAARHSVSGPSGSWTSALPGAATVGAGGDLVLVVGDGVYTAADGDEVVSLASDADAAVDRDLLWMVDGGGRITRQDLGAGTPATTVAYAPYCPQDRGYFGFRVRGRWAQVRCRVSSGVSSTLETHYLDLSGSLKVLTTTSTADLDVPTSLAEGVVAIGELPVRLRELGAEGPDRTVDAGSSSFGASGDGPGFVYRDRGGLHLLDPVLLGAADADTTAPTVSPLDALPTWVTQRGPVPLRWTSGDPAGAEGPASGIWHYELSQSDTSAFEPHRTYTHTVDATATSYAETIYGTTYYPCFRIRATDRRGNVGAWSAPACTEVDPYGPQARDVAGSITFHPRHGSRTVPVDYRFAAADEDSGIDHYETRTLTYAQNATKTGAWSTPVSSAKPLRTVSVAAGNRVCFEGRAVDAVGNVGPWVDNTTCTAAPYDDSVLSVKGPTKVFHSSAAYGGTARTLTGSASLRLTSTSTLSCVTVRALSATDTTAGTLLLYVNGRYRDLVFPSYPKRAWVNFYPGTGSVCGKGTIEVRHKSGTAPVTVDSVGLVRRHDAGYSFSMD